MPPYNMDCSSHSDSYYDSNNNSSQQSSSSSSSSNPSSPAKQPLHKLNKSTSNIETQNELVSLAALELESFRPPTSSANSNISTSNNSNSSSSPQRKVRKQNSCESLHSINSNSSNESADQIEIEKAFPNACLHLLHTLSGNTKCHDCLAPSPSWASVSYGITLCLQCSGKHRSLGVNVSYVKSLTLDSWKRTEILCMLEGGNGQLDTFFSRHEMGSPQIAVTRKTLDSSSNSSISPRGSPTTKTTVGVLDRYKTKASSFYRQHLKSHAKTIASKDGLYEGRDAHRNKKKSSSSKSSKRRGDKSSSSSSSSGGNKGKSKLLGEKMKKGNEVVQQILESVTEVDIDSSCGSTRSAGFM